MRPFRLMIPALGVAVAAATLAGCTLHDPQGRPPPGTNFGGEQAFGIPSRGHYVAPEAGGRYAGDVIGIDRAGPLAGLTARQRQALLRGCDMLHPAGSEDRTLCRSGEIDFEVALATGCEAAFEGERLAACLKPLEE